MQRGALEHEVAEALVDHARTAQRVDVALGGVDLRAQLGARLGVHDRDGGEVAETSRPLGVLGGEHVRPATSSRKITPMTSSWKIIGTAMIEWMSQKRTVDLMMRGSWCALSTITGRLRAQQLEGRSRRAADAGQERLM